MNCPKCNGKTTVTDVVSVNDVNEQYRKRKCVSCKHVFYTTEFEVEYTDDYADIWFENHRDRSKRSKKRGSKQC